MGLENLIGLNFKCLKSGFKKSLYISSMLVFAAFFSTIFFIHTAFAAATPGCGFFELSPECDLSGWFHLVLGDVLVGSLLAIFFHRLSLRTHSKL